MSLITRFTELCATFRLSESLLRVAVENGASTRASARILRRNATLLEKLEGFAPKTRGEYDELIDFLSRRRMESVRINSWWRSDTVAQLVNLNPAYLDPDPPWVPKSVRMPDPLPETLEPKDVAGMVLGTTARVSVLSPHKRFLTVSLPVARFWGSTPTRMSGLHMREVIGSDSYFAQERGWIDRVIDEGPQTYIYRSTALNGEEFAAHVRMLPVKDRTGQIYAIVRISRDPRPSEL